MTQDAESLAEAGVYPTAKSGFEHGLVVLAMGLAFWLVPDPRGYRLLVEEQHLREVSGQLAAYERESAFWPPPPPAPTPTRPSGRPALSPLLWALATIAAFGLQNTSARWERLGALDSQSLFADGQWWRPATSLFLHADAGHLVSNVVAGVWVFSLVLSGFGAVRGWVLIAAASLAANTAAAGLFYPGPYRSVGASTAVFAGLGLLTGRALAEAVRRQAPGSRRLKPILLPLAAGAVLLGLYGAGGAQTDVAAHACGFAVGVLLGII